MAIDNGYITLTELQNQLGLTNTQYDSALETIIEGTSRWIDNATGRKFYGYTDTKYYTADDTYYVYTDDICRDTTNGARITSVKTDDDFNGVFETTWTSGTDYLTRPYNHTPIRTTGGTTYTTPVRSLEVNLNGNQSFPLTQRSVEITAVWGYSEVTPSEIRTACLIAATRLWKRRDAVFGIAGTASLGTQAVIRALDADPDVYALLKGTFDLYVG